MTHKVLTRTAQIAANAPDASTAFDFTGADVSALAFSFATRGMSSGDTLAYYADNGIGQYERGLGTWNDSALTLTRTTIRESSTGSAITWTAAPTVWSDGRQEEDMPTGGAAWTSVEIDAGNKPVYEIRAVITDAAISASDKIVLAPDATPPAGRTADDWQWDGASLAAAAGNGQFTLYAIFHPGPIVGKRNILYQVA
jgi:hypothetical protein